ncbi:MAG: hypothetical protein QM736_05835 [Vicinamibacterales bacterium]
MVRVLVGFGRRSEDDAGADGADDRGEFECVGVAELEVRVAVELDELDLRAEELGGSFGFLRAFGGRAVGASLAARADGEVRRATGLRLARDDATGAELDVVGMRAEGQKGSGQRDSWEEKERVWGR